MDKKIKISLIILAVIGCISILSLFFLYNPLQYDFFPKCPIHTYTGTHCPGCGSQRAIHKILNGQIIEGLKHNLLIPLILVVLIYDITIKALNRLLRKKITNLLHKPIVTISILVIIILYWILRNIDTYPFTILAP